MPAFDPTANPAKAVLLVNDLFADDFKHLLHTLGPSS
jgi:hypothetical protein